MNVSIQLKRASAGYDGGPLAVRDIDLTIEPGERLGFVGPSGSGKTTLLRLLGGGLRPRTGSLRLDGQDLARFTRRQLRQARSRIGWVHQDLSLVPNLRVLANVQLGRLGTLSTAGAIRRLLWPPQAEVLRIHQLLERVGIPEKLYERTDRLSGGQRQRVAIARALFQEPAVLLADEPVSSVDPARARDTVTVLTGISSAEGLTLCVSLHNLPLAREFFPRLVGLRQGRIVFDCPSQELADTDFEALYDLSPEEMLEDGSRHP